MFVTLDGMKEIVNGIPDADEVIKHKVNQNKIFTNLNNMNHAQAQVGFGNPVLISVSNTQAPASSSNILATSGIYVLRVDSRPKPFFYVGKAENIERRIKQHMDGEGAYCIIGEPFTRVEPLTKGCISDMESWERNEVLTRMYEFGIDNVRGWMYSFKTMPIEQKVSAFDQICEKFDLCRKCGRNSHFVRDCYSMSTALWTCGMELRSTYNSSAHQQAAIEDAERRICEARRMVAEAGRVLGVL